MGDNKLLALNNVDVAIKEGEFVSIMGSSGSGKSTLMNIIGCLDTPSYGTYHLNGKSVSDLTEDELANIRNEEIGFVLHVISFLNLLSNQPRQVVHSCQRLLKLKLYTCH